MGSYHTFIRDNLAFKDTSERANPPPLTAAPTMNMQKQAKAALRQQEQMGMQAGYMSTILTGPSGLANIPVPSSPSPTTTDKPLLGT